MIQEDEYVVPDRVMDREWMKFGDLTFSALFRVMPFLDDGGYVLDPLAAGCKHVQAHWKKNPEFYQIFNPEHS